MNITPAPDNGTEVILFLAKCVINDVHSIAETDHNTYINRSLL